MPLPEPLPHPCWDKPTTRATRLRLRSTCGQGRNQKAADVVYCQPEAKSPCRNTLSVGFHAAENSSKLPFRVISPCVARSCCCGTDMLWVTPSAGASKIQATRKPHTLFVNLALRKPPIVGDWHGCARTVGCFLLFALAAEFSVGIGVVDA